MPPIKIIAKDRYWIPKKALSRKTVERVWSVPYETKRYCRETCPMAQHRGRYCNTCPSKDVKINLFKEITTKQGNEYWGVPSGDHELLAEAGIEEYKIDDRRAIIPFRHDLEWTGNLYYGQFETVNGERKQRPNQKAMVKAWVKHVKQGHTGGLVISPPRSGKTVIGCAASLTMEVRTLILASQIKWLHQFCKRFAELTNLKKYVAKTKRYPIALIDPRGWEPGELLGIKVLTKWGPEVAKADIVLASYQGLINEKTGELKLNKYVQDQFSLLIVDEVHQASAIAFSKLVNNLRTRYRLGLTATINRKDGLHPVTEAIMGRAVITGSITSTLPRLELFETGLALQNYKQWHRLEASIVKFEERNRAIVRQVFKDLRENPKNSILLPTNRIQHVKLLCQMINNQAKYNNANRGENWPADLAMEYHRAVNTDAVIEKVMALKCRVVVARASMIQMGLDVPKWTHVYVGIVPTSNAPIMYQLNNRVCTPYDGKPAPIVRYLIDSASVSVFCFAKLWFDKAFGIEAGILGKGLDRTNRVVAGPVRYVVSEDVHSRMQIIAQYPKSYSPTDAGVELKGRRSKTGRKFKNKWRPTKLFGIRRL